jgi:putative acetyltransferase
MYIRNAIDSDLDNILFVLDKRFGHGKEVDLVRALLEDPSAKPILSLIAIKDHQAVGYILFTAAHLAKSKDTNAISILSALAIIPSAQNQGIGGKLIESGLQILSDSGVDLVFVTGLPNYYSQYGFCSVCKTGISVPFLISGECSETWMVQTLYPSLMSSFSGKVVCCDELKKAKYWGKISRPI